MNGYQVKASYESIDEAVRSLNLAVKALYDPIAAADQEFNKVGEGGEAYSGTAADQIRPILNRMKANIETLQSTVQTLADEAGVSLENYEQADSQATQAIANNIGA